MTAIYRACLALCVAAVAGCAAEQPPQLAESEVPEVASTAQAVTLRECQAHLATCVRAARSLVALAECSAEFAECNTQAIADLTEERDTLADCAAEADECLEDADTRDEVQACRTAYRMCADDVVNGRLDDAIDSARDAIEDAFDAARDAVGTVIEAVDILNECRADALACVRDADAPDEVDYCRRVFVNCADEAVDLADSILDPLPGPTPGQVIEGFEDCRTESQECLVAAITEREITECRDVLEACVEDARDLAEDTLDELDQIADDLLPPGVPTPGEVINCNLALTECLLEFTPAPLCAADAIECLATVDAN